ncbi:hypothetical protein HGO37_03035 [Rhizobium sp. CG4]|uniref:hypothetical protein n=1 Tax=Rhizobium sp. CG4 TaxID=2726075 RepID=UPI00203471F6|nr:hypothetical protein [Rhizobium sp. CG4]MCM2454352.1 hypothetical protein [Rhizobium sp. CG4]
MLTTISLVIYVIGTAISLTMTYLEGVKKGRGWDVMRVMGLTLCFIWPALIVVMLVVISASGLKMKLARH